MMNDGQVAENIAEDIGRFIIGLANEGQRSAGDGKRFIVRSDEKLAAFLELERITHQLAVSALLDDDCN
jgi:hypothetical protein